VRYERLVVEAGDNTFTLDLHPGLTVVGGVGHMERDGLLAELCGALGHGRAGVHLEITSDSGSRFAIFRPHGARHRVIDVDEAVDVTAEFSDDAGNIDLLGRAGLTPREAKEVMRFSAVDLVTTEERDEMVRTLARVNQNELWVAAEALRQAQRRLDEEAAAVGTSAEDAEVIERIEARHAEFETSQALLERWRKTTFMASGLSAIGVVPAIMYFGTIAAVPLMLAAVAATLASILMWRRNEQAARAEEAALAEAGAQSYLGFHLQRVNGLLSSDQARKRLMQASEEHRDAQRRWAVIAGDVDLTWALSQRSEIAAAVKLRQDVVSLGMLPSATNDGDNERTTALAHALVGRLNKLRTLGPGNESFPAILDEPCAGVGPEITPSLLELLVRSSVHQQVILLTEDERIVQWAKLEAMTGALAVVEPSRVGVQRKSADAQVGQDPVHVQV
jgi:hypothetical protein